MTKPSRRRRGTRTSSFGTGGRVSHDASAYYGRAMQPAIEAPPPELMHEQPVPEEFLDRIFCHTSERMHELPDRSVHLMVTSPPYNVGKEYDDDLTLDEYRALLKRVMKETYRVLVPGGRACVNVANLGRKPYIPVHSYIIQDAVEELGFLMRGEIIWDKADSASPSTAWGSWRSAKNPTLRDTHEYVLVFSKELFGRNPKPGQVDDIDRNEFLELTKSVWVFGAESATRVDHPAPFPVELPRRLIKLLTFEGDVVLDPFMGSGSTGLAALSTRRRFVGYEINAHYVRTARQRIQLERSASSRLGGAASPRKGTVMQVATTLPARTSDAVRFIVLRELQSQLSGDVDDMSLSTYFDRCFAEVIAAFGLYPAWACTACLRDGKQTVAQGLKPERCPLCESSEVYEIGSFQRRASLMGSVFSEALRRAAKGLFGITFAPVPRDVRTHDFEVCNLAIASRGSIRRLAMPFGESQSFSGPGMLRSDTRKKVAANAQALKRVRPEMVFVVATNATRGGPIETPPNDIDGVFDVTTKSGFEALIRAARQAGRQCKRSAFLS